MTALFILFMALSLIIGYKMGSGAASIWISTVSEVMVIKLVKKFNLDVNEVSIFIQENTDSITAEAEGLLKERLKQPAKRA